MAKKIIKAVKKAVKKAVVKKKKEVVATKTIDTCGHCSGKGLKDSNTLCGACCGSGVVTA